MASVDVTRIASNIGALNALNSLNNINAKLAMHQTRLSTGKRINSAADDPAGLTIATKMLSRSEGMKVALDNIGDASNMLAVTESGLSKMNDILVIMRNKAEQAASDTLGTSERDAIATQLSAYANQIDSMVAETKWNSSPLLDGTVNKRFQTGVDDGEYTTFQMTSKFDPGTLGISTNIAADAANGLLPATATGVAAVGNPAAFSGLTKLSTGAYSIEVLGFATDTLIGKATALVNSTNPITTLAAVTGGSLTSGTHSIKISNVVGTTSFDYSIDGGTATTMAMAATGAQTIGATGISINVGGANAAATAAALTLVSASSNPTTTFDYIAKNTVKYQLKSGSGEVMAVDSDGVDSAPNGTSTIGYGTFGNGGASVTNTGRGVSITFKDTATVALGISTFNYAQQNKYSVDVSSAAKASSYMGTVNTAMDTVNKSLAGLGSLMARLSYKAEQVANAQVNIEGSYSRIMNANMAEEQMNASKYSILQQVAVSMLAQANQAPQSLLALFR